jgi:hypothetical protein
MTITETEVRTVKVGDIFRSSWGYDQTNVNFYEVVKVTPTGVRVRPIRQRIVRDDGYGSDYVEPLPGDFSGEPFFKRLRWGGPDYGWSLRIASYASAWIWNGKPARQTSSGWGH